MFVALFDRPDTFYKSVRNQTMGIDRRDIVEMLRHENELLKSRNEKLSARLMRHQQAFRALNQMDNVMRTLQASFDIKALVHELLALVLHASDAENGSMILLDDETNQLVFAEVIGETRDHLLNHRIDIDTGIVGHVVKTQQAMLVNDVRNSPQWSAEVDRVVGFNTNDLICAPLLQDENIFGAIEVVNSNSSEQFDENDLAILKVSAHFVSQALKQAEDITLRQSKA